MELADEGSDRISSRLRTIMATPPPATTTTAAPEEVSAVEGAPAAALPVVSIASLYVGDLAESVDETVLLGVFSQVAPVASVRVCRDTITGVSLGYGYVNFHTRQDVATDPYTGESKGCGFVQYENEESAQDAINGLNGMLAGGSKIFVGLHVRRQNREVKFTNVYIKNFPTEFTDDDLRQEFAPFGEITSAVVIRHSDGTSKCFGFVNFEKQEYAAEAIKNLNGKSINDKVVHVGRAQKKAERQAELKVQFQQGRDGKVEKPQGINLYLKNLDDSINDEKLKKLFEEFGEITSCKITLDSKGRSKGSGFVSFATTEAGHSAINAMNGKMVENKPLYVGLHQPKGQRRAMLTVYFGHPTPGQIPPQAAVVFGFPPHLVPGMGPGTPFVMPQNVQRIGARHGAMLPQMYRQQQQMTIHPNANQRVRYMLNARNGAYPPKLPQGFASVMPSVQQDVSNLTSALASASPEEQQQMLGTKLYPLVEHLEPGQAAKVTGMLLEMDKVEILNLLESPEALRAKVREAMLVLQRSAPGGSADPAATVAAQQ
ncbi:hypothetical protein HU200_013677 [Digitaria exilis]|uniref:Polyadenylate-binding protein n=1 Tax=Digitaria exilis TaxID=1010633 RepID=A0A835KKU1_9POAL|nr:hypothetical protein HU200_013677 [Digitaria exilis]